MVFKTESKSQHFEGYHQQDSIDGKVSVLNRESGSEINNRGNARYSTGGDVVRKQEESPSDAVKDHSQGNH